MALGNIKLNVSRKVAENRDEARWNELTDAIMAGNVIPVIGPDLLVDKDEENGNLHQQLIDLLASACEVKSRPTTFSQLVYDKDFIYATNPHKDAIYSLLKDVLDQVQSADAGNTPLKPGSLLVRLLKLQKFPFVITTSFTPLVELAMQQAWPGKEIRVLQFRNDSNRDLKPGCGDITNEQEMQLPTVFYMFGKYSIEPHRYVVTDMDMMDFCRTWLAGGNGIPRVLSEVLKKRYLLVLGNNYSDWLFRFIWYSIRRNTDNMRSSMMVNDSFEPSLREFLSRLQTFIEQDPEFAVSEIERRVRERTASESTRKEDEKTDKDVFLSYSRRDAVIVERIYRALTARGLRVWYDMKDIPDGANWKNTFRKGVDTSRLFIPVLSMNVANEYMEPHEYRDEWNRAADIAAKMGGRDFIWPLAERGFDFYADSNRLPQAFRENNATWYTVADDFAEFAEKVALKVGQLKEQEQKTRAQHGK